MLYRVSFYRTAEVVEGRAPRYMVDVDAKSTDDAISQVVVDGMVAWGAYKTPKNSPIKETSRYYVFVTPEDRERWYQKLKAEKRSGRKCRKCGGPVPRRFRECESCKAEAEKKRCADCGVEISSRRRCEPCAEKHERAMEKRRRDEKRAGEAMAKMEEKIRQAEALHPTGHCCQCLASYLEVQKSMLAELRAGNYDVLDIGHIHMCRCQIAKVANAC